MSNIESLPLALTVQELADVLSISINTVYKLIYGEQIKAVKVGRQYRISRKALLDFLGMTAA